MWKPLRLFSAAYLGMASFGMASSLLAGPTWAVDRTVAVSGFGEVQAEPDRATVSLGVEARKPQLEAARTEVARGVDGILKLSRELKIDPKYVRTTRLTVQPEYDWNNSSHERRLIGYFVQRQVEIDLRDLERLGLLLERAVSLGANQVGDPQLDASRRRDLEREALVKAIEDAHANAETAARAAGAKLGAVRTITANSNNPAPLPRPMMMKAQMASSDSQRAENYQAGMLRFGANAEVTYDLSVP